MDKYYLATVVPPPVEPPMLIKESGNTFSKWDGEDWAKDQDAAQYLMGDYEVRQVSLQEAEEHMRGIAP